MYEPKVGHVVCLSDQYQGPLRTKHEGRIGIVRGPASNPAHQAERNCWLVNFSGEGSSSWNYHASEIRLVEVGAKVWDTRTKLCGVFIRVGHTAYILQGHSNLWSNILSDTLRLGEPLAAVPSANSGGSPAGIQCPADSIPASAGSGGGPSQPAPKQVLAKVLFCTDPRVKEFATQKSECVLLGLYDEKDGAARYQRVLAVMWERNEHGWRTEAEARCQEMANARKSPFCEP